MKKQRRPSGSIHRSAFTLVEMLVSVALVLVIMSLFATTFRLASDTVRLQRGISSNDQRARALFTVIRNDFQKRTQRYVYPFHPTEDAATSPTPFGTRGGYLYISTNDPSSFYDDLIQFTVDARLVQQNHEDTSYYGMAKLFFDQIAESAGTPHGTGVLSSPHQPEADDRDIRHNNMVASSAAEVMFFLRNGNLIRRVSLLRDPGPIDSNGTDNQPISHTGNDFIVDASDTSVPAGAAGGGRFFYVANPSAVDLSDPTQTTGLTIVNSDDFLTHFDLSARPHPPHTGAPTSAQLLGLDALNNEIGSTQFPLGQPWNRWGFNPVNGFSREHDSTNRQVFLGRFVHAETSDPSFNWPLAPSLVGNGNIMDVQRSPVTLPSQADVVSEFSGGTGRGGERRVEDVLLTNVHEFRIEIWDERLGKYVAPGYGSPNEAIADQYKGDFHIDRSLQVGGGALVEYVWGPLAMPGLQPFTPGPGVQPHVFDTWHPDITEDFNKNFNPAEITETQPPYLPYQFYPPRQSDSPPGPSSRRAPTQLQPFPADPADAVTYWTGNTEYSVGDVVFARDTGDVSGWDAHANGQFHWTHDAAAIPAQAFQIAYRCVVAGTSKDILPDQTPPDEPPSWPTTPGRIVADNTVRWEAFDNRLPLKSIRMTMRFKDEASDQIRQLTMILPLTDD